MSWGNFNIYYSKLCFGKVIQDVLCTSFNPGNSVSLSNSNNSASHSMMWRLQTMNLFGSQLYNRLLVIRASLQVHVVTAVVVLLLLQLARSYRVLILHDMAT